MDLMTEAQEELRQERAKHYFKKYGPYVAIIIALLLVVVGGKQAWHAYNHHQDVKNTTALLNASDSLEDLLVLSQNIHAPQGVMAGLIAFTRMDETQQKTDGLQLLNDLYTNKKNPSLWRDYAGLLYVRHTLATQGHDADTEALLSVLDNLTKDADSAFYSAAVIEHASITGILNNDTKNALNMLQSIENKELPVHLTNKRDDLILYFNSLDKAS